MDQPRSLRNVHVCKVCRVRKKACDKVLPRCGYCDARNLACDYDRSPSLQGVASTPGKWRLWTPSGTVVAERWSSASQESGSAHLEASLLSPLCTLRGTDMDDTLWAHVSQVIDSFDISVNEITDRFFEGVHTWLPMLSPRQHRSIATNLGDRAPPQGFSILVLAMCLVVLRSSARPPQTSSIDLRSLYLTVKSTFAQMQAVVRASTAVIQAGILIAVYEYACGNLQAAYVSIGGIARMCSITGIDLGRTVSSITQTDFESLEERNAWWSVLILERQILLEIPDRVRYLMTAIPDDEIYFPVQLDRGDTLIANPAPMLASILPIPQNEVLDGFGRQAQAIRLLDRVLTIMQGQDDQNTRLVALASLDRELQDFLAVTMSEYRGPGSHCGANATALRTLYLIHQSILSQSHTGERGRYFDAQHTASSRAALNTTAKMMADVASDHLRQITNIDRLPICAGYNFELCIRHLEALQLDLGNDALLGLGDLRTLVHNFRARWPNREGNEPS